MFTIESILIPTDFSLHADDALGYAKALATPLNAVLHLVHVIEPVVYPVDWGYSGVGFIDVENEYTTAAEKEIDSAVKKLVSEGYTVKTSILHGRASEQILNYADENKISLICIATHGRGGFEHFLFGSTTEKVLRKSNCPVFVVRQRKD